MKHHNYYFYILTNRNNTVLYTGMCNNLKRRVLEHKSKVNNPRAFTARYNINKLVYYEYFEDINYCIAREKQIKAGSRQKKIELIEVPTAEAVSLYNQLINEGKNIAAGFHLTC